MWRFDPKTTQAKKMPCLSGVVHPDKGDADLLHPKMRYRESAAGQVQERGQGSHQRARGATQSEG